MRRVPSFEETSRKNGDPPAAGEAAGPRQRGMAPEPRLSRRAHSRRAFLGRVTGATAAGVTASILDLPRLLETTGAELEAAQIGPLNGRQRRNHAYEVRHRAALAQKHALVPDHLTNGDEELYANQIGSYSKGLPHDELGEVERGAYDSLIRALTTGRPADFENIPLGCPVPSRQRRLVNPQAALAFDLEGADSHQMAIPPAPAFSSAEESGEMAELYWMAVARDVPFTEYASHLISQMAAGDLSKLSDFRGPKQGGQVTVGTLFRGSTPGDLVGPYLSQFLLRPVPFGPQSIDQRIRTLRPGIDHLVQYGDWLNAQRGCAPDQADRFDATLRFLRNGRDLAQYAHVDVLFQAYFNACLILLAAPDPTDPVTGGGIGAPLDAGNPYSSSRTQHGFGTFGNPHIATLVAEVSTRALKSVWCEKWAMHRRLRPEAFGGRVHNHAMGAANYPIHADILTSPVLDEVLNRNRSFLLPQAYPEGSPLHPAYGAGHATVAGACVTILKAWFDEGYVIPNPVVPSPDGRSLVLYTGPGAGSLTVGGELNKLAANIAMGRNFAGIHWRSDYNASIKLGEAVAINLLTDQRLTYNEIFSGFSLSRFDGTTIRV
jgi:hypothetical protein